jgi:hypothetical protein
MLNKGKLDDFFSSVLIGLINAHHLRACEEYDTLIPFVDSQSTLKSDYIRVGLPYLGHYPHITLFFKSMLFSL